MFANAGKLRAIKIYWRGILKAISAFPGTAKNGLLIFSSLSVPGTEAIESGGKFFPAPLEGVFHIQLIFFERFSLDFVEKYPARIDFYTRNLSINILLKVKQTWKWASSCLGDS